MQCSIIIAFWCDSEYQIEVRRYYAEVQHLQVISFAVWLFDRWDDLSTNRFFYSK